jgi:uncharacterized protein YkwD
VTRRLLRFSLVPALLGALLLSVPAAAPAATKKCANADLMPTAENVAQVRGAVLCLLNVERRKRRMVALKESPQLRRAAQSFSRTMVDNSFFDHISPGGSTLLSRVKSGTAYLADVANFALGENIAWGSGDLATPRQTMKGWMNSSGHKRNILNRRFRHVGIGVAIGAPIDAQGLPAATYTTDFGYRKR